MARSRSSPGVRMVTASGAAAGPAGPTRISSGSSTARVSGRRTARARRPPRPGRSGARSVGQCPSHPAILPPCRRRRTATSAPARAVRHRPARRASTRQRRRRAAGARLRWPDGDVRRGGAGRWGGPRMGGVDKPALPVGGRSMLTGCWPRSPTPTRGSGRSGRRRLPARRAGRPGRSRPAAVRSPPRRPAWRCWIRRRRHAVTAAARAPTCRCSPGDGDRRAAARRPSEPRSPVATRPTGSAIVDADGRRQSLCGVWRVAALRAGAGPAGGRARRQPARRVGARAAGPVSSCARCPGPAPARRPGSTATLTRTYAGRRSGRDDGDGRLGHGGRAPSWIWTRPRCRAGGARPGPGRRPPGAAARARRSPRTCWGWPWAAARTRPMRPPGSARWPAPGRSSWARTPRTRRRTDRRCPIPVGLIRPTAAG